MVRILVVDDDPDIRSAIALALEREGYECVLASSVRAAYEVISETEIDLMILDLYLPGKDGFSVLKEGHPPTQTALPPVLAISGGGPTFTASVGITAARAMGVEETLYKPFSSSELVNAVHRLLKGSDGTV